MKKIVLLWLVIRLRSIIENGNIINSVNYPAISLARTNADDTRFCVAHKNVPELLKKVLTQISGNVENMLSKSRGDYAYTIIDVAAPVQMTLQNRSS